ncbi:MAG: hypothetical protein RIS47_1114 [Bacteroidota bacterium]|jgi:4-alpha-glucanotransferase
MLTDRKSGVILHPSSLPGRFGIGSLGAGAYAFVDFLQKAGQQLWQILPLGPTTYGDSPYQSFSAFAGNPSLIDIDRMVKFGLLSEDDLSDEEFSDSFVDFENVQKVKHLLLRKAYKNFKSSGTYETKKEFVTFIKNNDYWLEDYAMFMAIKEIQGGKAWQDWDEGLKRRDEKDLAVVKLDKGDTISFYMFSQFVFFRQWSALKAYSNAHGVQIIGDLPIYVSGDSADAWANPQLFEFDEDLRPTLVAGVPPDAFSETGQLWGNPIYDWEFMQETQFDWWVKRMKANLSIYDYVRVDHFRGFEGYWVVPATEDTAVNGSWVKAPGMQLFKRLQEVLGDLPIIAEDLGVITPEVEELRDGFNLPGMKVLQFAFESDAKNSYLMHHHIRNSVVYTGTHDNDTVLGWYQNLGSNGKRNFENHLVCVQEPHWDMIRYAWSSPSRWALTVVQDLLGLDSAGRMNTPGTSSGNWTWRLLPNRLNDEIADRLLELTQFYDRIATCCEEECDSDQNAD